MKQTELQAAASSSKSILKKPTVFKKPKKQYDTE